MPALTCVCACGDWSTRDSRAVQSVCDHTNVSPKALDASDPEQMSLVPTLQSEVLLRTKESNAKARAAAFDLIVAMAYAEQRAGDGPGLVGAAASTPSAPPSPYSLTAYFRLVRLGSA